MDYGFKLIAKAYNTLWIAPLNKIYFHGPTWLGFWGGKQACDMCAHLTKITAEHWMDNPEVCRSLLSSQFNSFVTMFEFSIYWTLVVAILACLFFRTVVRHCVIRPVLRDIKEIYRDT